MLKMVVNQQMILYISVEMGMLIITQGQLLINLKIWQNSRV
jgi:hypothetical protein